MHQKLYGLDHLRAFAILFVFLYHYQLPFFGHPGWLENVAEFGWTGVDLFFVLSGFLISSQLFAEIKKKNSISLKTFFIKRIFRILPAYWSILLIYFCIPLFHEREALPPLWKFLTFTQNFGTDLLNGGTFSHAWSLCVEEHFYFLLPFLLLLLLVFARVFRKGCWLLLAFFIAGFVIRTYSWNHFYVPAMHTDTAWIVWYRYIYYPSYNRLDGLLTGIGIAALYQFAPLAWSRIIKFGNLLLLFGLLLLITAYFCFENKFSYLATVVGFPLISIAYGLIVMGAISPGSILYKWNSGVMTLIATLSYAIYLLHKGVVHLTQEFIALPLHLDVNSNAMFFICMLTNVCAAGLLYLLIEKPFMNWRKRITG
jgi:peptidoglycan/LPS O-acetylase OafA/YrhL